MKRFASFRSLVAISAICAASAAYSQSSDQPLKKSSPRASDAGQLEDVVVTATKMARAQKIQSLPASANAFSGSQLEELHIQDVTGLAALVPSAVFNVNSTFPGAANYFIRGIGANTSDPSDEPSIGTFVDGMYLGLNLGVINDLFDTESVEVLRGPQGTLFGHNVTGGAVVIRSKRPTGDFGLSASATVGNYGEADADLSIQGPLVEGKVAAKIAFLSESHDGYFTNAADPGQKIGGHNSQVIRPIVTFTPTDSLTVALIGEAGQMNDYGSPGKNLFFNTNVSPPGPTDKWTLVNNGNPSAHQHWESIVSEAKWNVGPGVWTTTATYRKYHLIDGTDVAGTYVNVFAFVRPSGIDQHQSSVESTYAFSPFSSVDLSTGLYFFKQDYLYKEVRQQLVSIFQAGAGSIGEDAGGAFAQADIRFMRDWTLTLGGRYSIDRKDAAIANLGSCNPSETVCKIDFVGSKSWSDFSPKAAIQWMVNPDLQFYTSYTTGFRSGGFNVRNSAGSPGPYDPESVDAYEAGMKSEWFDRTVRLNVAAYRNVWTNMQLTAINSLLQQKTLNAGRAIIQGIEIEPTIKITPNFSLWGSYSYIDAYYTQFKNAPVANPALATDLPISEVPENEFTVGSTYQIPVPGDRGQAQIRASYNWVDKRYLAPVSTAAQYMVAPNTLMLPSYGLLNGGIDYTTSNGQITVSLFGKNLTNAYHVTTGTPTALFLSEWISPPRTFGIRLSFSYK